MFDEIPKSWQTDNLLHDHLPAPKNQWLTANKLIELNEHSKIYLLPDILNLYAIMVRKIDFQSGERLLQRLPYVTLPCEISQQIRKQSLALAERCHFYFQDTAIDYSIKKWQQKIIDYTENQKRLPFPLFRLSDYWQGFLTREYVPFQSARGECFHIPTKLSRDLAYFLGMVIGDGHLNYHNVVLVDFSEENMLMLQSLTKTLFGFEGPVTGEKKIWLLHLNNKWLVRLVNFLTNQPITGKKYHALREPLIFQDNEMLRWEFWSGALDADGSYKNKVSFCSSSNFFVKEFINVLNAYNIKHTFRTLNTEFGTGYSVDVKATSKDILSKYLQPRHPQKQKEYQRYLLKKRLKLIDDPIKYQINDINPDAIIKINDESYFNFELLPFFNVMNCTSYLKSARKIWSWTQQELADYLSIPKGQLANYESRDNLPLPLLVKLLPKLPNTSKQLMIFLSENKLNLFRSRKATAKLDLQPNKKLLSFVKSFSIRDRYLLIHQFSGSKNDFYHVLSDYFDVKVINNKLENSVLYQFVTTFFQTKKEE